MDASRMANPPTAIWFPLRRGSDSRATSAVRTESPSRIRVIGYKPPVIAMCRDEGRDRLNSLAGPVVPSRSSAAPRTSATVILASRCENLPC